MVRMKLRYLLCEVCVSDRSNLSLVDDGAIYPAAKTAVSRAHGDYGAALSSLGFSVKYLNAHTGIVFLCCWKSHYRLIWSALPFITSLENRGERVPCFLNCLHVGAERSEIRKAVLSCTLKKDTDDDYEEESGEEKDK
ncbi:ribonuclease P/MRP protein subunit POP5 isoform X2 [Coregonus clupeaformis]|uniref:ribonuclease P/MRP protein subunit POP5 isoform X2 n=1 Tax=Coregonus clupeaformis TaxID=59861 RepID=UPI001BDFC391|nr:ribonuclease P/MRP protein subunit POP5 isoform X2 [Coregonus clupeaformis]